MKVKRFTATSMQKALKTVRDEMGPDAVILSNHRVNGGVEIIVAQNYEPVSAHKSPTPYMNDDVKKTKSKGAKKSKSVAKHDVPAPQSFLSDELDKITKANTPPIKPAAAKLLAVKGEGNAASNPWPFLSRDERHDVEEQLRLQDQLESLKAHHETSPIQLPQDKAGLQQALQNIKQQREEGGNTPIEFTQSASKGVSHTAMPDANKKLIDEVRNELHDLTEMLKASSNQSLIERPQPASFMWKKYSPSNALQAKLWVRLENMGFDEWLIYQLLGKLESQQDEKLAWQSCLQELSNHISMCPDDLLMNGGIFALVGPTGAGKTTSIAKMAVRFTLEHEGAKVGLITMDNYRLAAHDQLRTLGQILGVQVLVADQDHSLLGCIESLQECDLVLIDTAGLSPEHPMLNYQLEQLAQLKGRINTFLTLPATSNSRVLRKVYHNYKAAHLTGCILSKVDEASSLGEAISVLLESALPLNYITDGQRIPDDFQRVNAKGLVKRVVQVAKQEQQLAYTTGLSAGAW
jgi:flagellar biosynthesis protein FlhF